MSEHITDTEHKHEDSMHNYNGYITSVYNEKPNKWLNAPILGIIIKFILLIPVFIVLIVYGFGALIGATLNSFIYFLQGSIGLQHSIMFDLLSYYKIRHGRISMDLVMYILVLILNIMWVII
jgi:hypothetical protein